MILARILGQILAYFVQKPQNLKNTKNTKNALEIKLVGEEIKCLDLSNHHVLAPSYHC